MEPLQNKQSDHGCPNLDAKSVLARSYERLHLQVLLQSLEEQFDLPSVLVDGRNSGRAEARVVRQQHDILVLLFVVHHDSPQRSGKLFRRRFSGQHDDLVEDDVSLLRNFPDFDDVVARVALHSGDEEHPLVVPSPELFVVDVPPVHRHDGAGLEVELFRLGVVVPFRVGDRDERRHVVVVVEQHVYLHSALGSPVVRPRKERQTEADGGRVEGEEPVFEAELRLSVPQSRGRAEVIVQNPEELFEESGGTMGVDEQSKRTTRLGKPPRRSPAYRIRERGAARRLLQPDMRHHSLQQARPPAISRSESAFAR